MENQEPYFELTACPAKIKEFVEDKEIWRDFQQTLIDSQMQEISKQFDEKLKLYVMANLAKLGYIFKSDSELFEFASKRITRIKFESKPFYTELYLDFVDENNRGKLIGFYSDNTEYNITHKDFQAIHHIKIG
jgi:hypothetical protein